MSPSRTAVAWRLATSEPAPGSENSWHQISSPRSIGGRYRFFCSSLPHSRMVGPGMPIPMKNTPTGSAYGRASSPKAACSAKVSPWPPYSSGQVMPTNPASYSRAWKAF